MKARWRARTAMIAAIGALLGCDEGTSPTGERDPLPTIEIVLGVGETVQLDGSGIMVTLDAIAEDSRCPTDAVCVWEGRVVADLRLGVFDEAPDDVRLDSSVGGGAAEWRDARITLLSVSPEAISDVVIPPGAYRLRLRLEAG